MSEKIRLRELPGAVFFVGGQWPTDKFTCFGSHRADLASGLAGTLYGYTSILREPGGHPLGGRDGFACGKPLHRWGQRFVHLSACRIRRFNVNPVQPIEQTTIDSNGVGASHRPALPGLRFLRSEASASADGLLWPLTADGAVAHAIASWNNAAAILSEKYFQGILGKRKSKGRGVKSMGKTLGRAIWNMVLAAFLLWLAAAGIGRLFFAERFRQDAKMMKQAVMELPVCSQYGSAPPYPLHTKGLLSQKFAVTLVIPAAQEAAQDMIQNSLLENGWEMKKTNQRNGGVKGTKGEYVLTAEPATNPNRWIVIIGKNDLVSRLNL